MCEKVDVVIVIGLKIVELCRRVLRYFLKQENVINFILGVCEDFIGVRRVYEDLVIFYVLISGFLSYFSIKGCDVVVKVIKLLNILFYYLIVVVKLYDEIVGIIKVLFNEGINL